MMNKKMGVALLVASMAFGTSAAQAESFSTMGAISATPLSATQMKSVEGKQHVYLLVESRGVELPAQGEAATRAAAPTPQNDAAGNSPDFARSPSRDAAAFVTALGAPPTPTRR